VKCFIKFAAAVLLVSITTVVTPPIFKGSDPAPLCDPFSQICKPPLEQPAR
jgi:hypothetical protein